MSAFQEADLKWSGQLKNVNIIYLRFQYFRKDKLSGHVDNKYSRSPVEKFIQMQNWWGVKIRLVLHHWITNKSNPIPGIGKLRQVTSSVLFGYLWMVWRYLFVLFQTSKRCPQSFQTKPFVQIFCISMHLFSQPQTTLTTRKTKQVRLKRKPHPGKPEHHCSSSTLLATLYSLCNMSFYPRVWVFQQASGHRADEPHGGGC